MRIGPEPTTDSFIAVMHGDTEGVVPGNALVVDPKKPFRKLNAFGNAFLNRYTHTLTQNSRWKALMANAVGCLWGYLCIVKTEGGVPGWSMWTQRERLRERVEKKGRLRVLVRIHKAALHSCVIEFPSAHCSGFSLFNGCLSVSERASERERVVFAESSFWKRKSAKNASLLLLWLCPRCEGPPLLKGRNTDCQIRGVHRPLTC